jgi:hypothetical protein
MRMKKALTLLCCLMTAWLSAAQASAEALPKEENKMYLQIGDRVLTVQMTENTSVQALFELLAEGPLTLEMADYAGMEKGAALPESLPENNEPMNTVPGDVILFQGRTFVIYYGTNSWSLTPLGKVQGVAAEELRELLGEGDVSVTLSLTNPLENEAAD